MRWLCEVFFFGVGGGGVFFSGLHTLSQRLILELKLSFQSFITLHKDIFCHMKNMT